VPVATPGTTRPLLKTEKMRPIKVESICWYWACVRTSTCEGTTARCGCEWYLQANTPASRSAEQACDRESDS
jgi:hypothetical protein